MKDKNIYHLTMGYDSNNFPEIHADIHRPSDYITDKIYLLSKISDFIEKERTFGVINGFNLESPTGISPSNGFQEMNDTEYSIPDTSITSYIQFGDGDIIISHKFLDEIKSYKKTGEQLEHPLRVVDYFEVLYCPKEKNIISKVDLDRLSDGTYHVYIKHKYDRDSNKILFSNVSRTREKTAIVYPYTFLAGDNYEVVVLSTLKTTTDSDYYNHVLIGTFQKSTSGSSYTINLKLEGYSSKFKLNEKIYLINNNYTDRIAISFQEQTGSENFKKKYYFLNFNYIRNYLNSNSTYSKIEHFFDSRTGKILLDSHFYEAKGTLTSTNPNLNLNTSSSSDVKYYIVFKEQTTNKKLIGTIVGEDMIIEFNSILSSLNYSYSGGTYTFSKNGSNDIDYFIYKIDKGVFSSY